MSKYEATGEACDSRASVAESGMDSLKFMGEVGASMVSDRISSVSQQAREAAERAQQQAEEAANRLRLQAGEMADSCKNLDISKIDVQSYGAQLRDSASRSVCALSSTVTQVAAGEWTSPMPNSSEGSSSMQEKPLEDGSDSGVDDGGWAGGGGSSSLSSMASRFGFSAPRHPERQGLIPKNDLESGGGAAGASSGLGAGTSWATIREFGVASATSMGSNLGLVQAPKEPETRLERLCACCPSLTYRQRLLGFVVCFVFGGLLSLSALNSLPSLLLGNPAPFAFKYTLGNLLSLSSSAFLVGPEKQCRDMLTPERRLASLTYLLTLVGTLVCVFVLRIQLLSFCFIIVQFCALTWYMLSYVPYGQVCLKRIIARVMAK